MANLESHKSDSYLIDCKSRESATNEQDFGKDTDHSHGVALSHLKKEFEHIQCPYCSQWVKTTTSRGSIMEYGLIFGLIGITLLIGTLKDTVKVSLLVYFAIFRNEITHRCSSCGKKIAVYNKFTNTIRVQAPSFGLDLAALPCTVSIPSAIPSEKLRNQSELVQCPHCHHFVYSKLSGGFNMLLLLTIYGFMFWLPFVTYNQLVRSHDFYPALVMPIHLLFGTHLIKHSCPSCCKKMASFNIFTGKTTVTPTVTLLS